MVVNRVLVAAAAGSEADWVLDLVAVGFDKPLGQLEGTMRTHADVQAASDAFCSAHCKVRGRPALLAKKLVRQAAAERLFGAQPGRGGMAMPG